MDNVVSFTQKLKEIRERQQDIEPELVDVPSIEEVHSFLKVLSFIQQSSIDGTGRIYFDDFSARIVVDANRSTLEDDINIRVANTIEANIPLLFSTLNEDERIGDPDEDVTEEEIAIAAHDIIRQFGVVNNQI